MLEKSMLKMLKMKLVAALDWFVGPYWRPRPRAGHVQPELTADQIVGDHVKASS